MLPRNMNPLKMISRRIGGELNSSAKEQWYKKYAIDHDIMDEDLQTYDDYENDYDLESYSEQYTTESGDNIVVFGRYGRDG